MSIESRKKYFKLFTADKMLHKLVIGVEADSFSIITIDKKMRKKFRGRFNITLLLMPTYFFALAIYSYNYSIPLGLLFF